VIPRDAESVLYFYDTGLMTWLLGIEDARQVRTHPPCSATPGAASLDGGTLPAAKPDARC